jgi:hypothetical protein
LGFGFEREYRVFARGVGISHGGLGGGIKEGLVERLVNTTNKVVN